MTTLPERLLALRQERNVSQNLRYERGEREPTASVLALMADFYGVTIDYLMGRSEERP